MNANNETHEAKYVQVKAQLLRMIQDENRFPDRCLPSERELCDMFGVSRITVRRAVADLELDGVLFRVQGKGAFVNAAKIQQPLFRVSSFTQDMNSRQMKPGSRISRVRTNSLRANSSPPNSVSSRRRMFICSSACVLRMRSQWRLKHAIFR